MGNREDYKTDEASTRKSERSETALHLARIGGIAILIVLSILYPFLPGQYDVLAVQLSLAVQLFGIVGVLFVPIGLWWLIHEVRKQRRRNRGLPYRDNTYRFTLASTGVFLIIGLAVFVVIFFAFNKLPGLVILALWVYVIYKVMPKLKRLKESEAGDFNPAPLYLVFLPVFALFLPLLLAGSVTEWSRNRAIANSSEFKNDIEGYRAQYGHYPASLLAQWKDYYPDVVGVEKYHYTSYGDSYNLFFEQPRFLLDNLGTREWVVYNPRDEHRVYSHTAWFLLLSPEELERSQGWYAVHDTEHPHWKYFWFD